MRKRIFNRSHIIVALLLLLLVKVLAEVSVRLSLFDPLQQAVGNFSILDVYYQIQNKGDKNIANPFITIVDISEVTDRSKIAEVIYEINACEPAVVGIDVIFNGLMGDSIGSAMVEEAIRGIESPVVAFQLDGKDDTGSFTDAIHSFFLPMEHVEEGYINMQAVSVGEAVREMGIWNVLNGDTVYSLPYMTAHAFSPDVVSVDWPKRHLIDYTPTKFTVVPHDSVLFRQELIKDHIVLLGTTKDPKDIHYSPYGPTPGSVIQAYMIQTLIEHHHIREIGFWWIVLITFVVLVITSVAQQEISYRAQHCRCIVIRFLFQTDLIKNVMNFIWMAFLMWVNFMIFTQLDTYFNPTIMLICIVLLVEVRLFYDSAIKAYKEHKRRKQLKKYREEQMLNNNTTRE